MNGFLVVSGVLAAAILVGHATLGRSQFFLPMRAATFEVRSKRMMEFVWHMTTVALVLPPIVLVYAGLGLGAEPVPAILIGFVGVQFAAWGLVHLLLATTSGIPGAIYKLFQWTLFLGVAATAFLGLAVA